MVLQKFYFTYSFIGGGSNVEIATTMDEAIEKAHERWADCDNLRVDESSFNKHTDEEFDQLMGWA